MPATPITLWLGCGATLLHGLWEKKGHHLQCERRWWKTGLVLADNFDGLLAWLPTEEKSQAEAAKYGASLDGVKQERHRIVTPEDMTQGGFFVMM